MTILLAIQASACLGITGFFYVKSYSTVQELSDSMIKEISEGTIGEIKNLTDKITTLLRVNQQEFADVEDISFKNKKLTNFLCNILQDDQL